MNELVSLLLSLVVVLVGGFIVGYALKKVIKIVMIVGGILILGIIVLQGMGWADIHANKITNDTANFVENTDLYPQVSSFVNQFNPIVFIFLIGGGIWGFVKAG